MKKLLALLLVTSMAMPLTLTGCAPKIGSAQYSADGAQTAQRVEYGTVKSVRVVHVNNDNSVGTGIGTVGGGVLGGVLGSMIGSGRGKTLATAAGAVVGAVAGYGGSKALGAQEGYEITVTLDNGSTMAVTQGADVAFQPGQRVKVLSGGGSARVAPE